MDYQKSLDMKVRWILAIGCMIFYSGLNVDIASAEWTAQIHVVGQSLERVSGYSVSLGIGSQAQVAPAPPDPPIYSVKMELLTIDNEFSYTKGPFSKDIRQKGDAICQWLIAINPYGNIASEDATRTATIYWNPSQFGQGDVALHKWPDDMEAPLIPDMKAVASHDVTGPDGEQYFLLTFRPSFDLQDVIIPLQVLAGLNPRLEDFGADINRNGKVETEDVLYALQAAADMGKWEETYRRGNPLVFRFTFSDGKQGWTGGFSDYPLDSEEFYSFKWDWHPLPEGLCNGYLVKRSSLYITGDNLSDDLFMFIKKQLHGLRPETRYALTFIIKFATSAPVGCEGVGGSPSDVWLKAGATIIEPISHPSDDNTVYQMNIDKGNQFNSGKDAVILGDVGNSKTDCKNFEYEIKELNNQAHPFEVTTDAEGSVWMIVGTDSGYEAVTSLYYATIEIRALEL